MIDFSLYDILFQGDFLITLGVLHFMFGFEENLKGTVVSHVGGGTCNSSFLFLTTYMPKAYIISE